MSNLVAFDLDCTLIEGHVSRPDPDGPFVQVLPFLEVRPILGVLEKLQKLRRQLGTEIAICTNKAGVSWGHATIAECEAKRDAVLEALEIPEARWYEAYAHPGAPDQAHARDLHLRKPAPGMIIRAMADARCEPQTTLFVGDMRVDLEAAYRAGCEFRWAYKYFGRAKPPIE